MAGSKRGNTSVEEAAAWVCRFAPVLERVEKVSITDCAGRVLAEDMTAGFDNPPFDRAPVDGYACIAADTKDASRENPARLKVLTEVDAGGFFAGEVHPGECVRIMTGAAIPAGCNVCIRQEDTDYGEEIVEIYEPYPEYMNYCYAGEDFKKGTLMVAEGTKLGYVEAGILASMGVAEVPVYGLPRIAILTTGDEIVEPGNPLGLGKIYNSNLYGLIARMKELGLKPVVAGPVGDSGEAVAEGIRKAFEICDLVITTGGVSVGKKDILHEAIPMIGADQQFWGVALKPGTPTIFAVYEGKPLVCLSGNPFGALANFELLIRPALAKMCHDESLAPVWREGVMASSFGKASHGRRFIRACYQDGKVSLPDGLHSSGVLGSLLGCNCMVDIAPGTPCLNIGDPVRVVMVEA